MSLSNKELLYLLELAKLAAIDAGLVISKAQTSSMNIHVKETGSTLSSQVVTEVDLMAEKVILDILSPTLRKFDFGLLTEESTDDRSRFEKNYFWCIDPLDGTLYFAQGKEGYSTSIALVSREGNSILGVVYDPVNTNLYYSLLDKGAFKNDHPFLVNDQKKDSPPLLLTDGPAVMNALRTIESGHSLFYKRPKVNLGGGSLWDYAATSVIHREAGGYQSDWNGKPFNLNKVNSTFMNDCGVLFSSHEKLVREKYHLH